MQGAPVAGLLRWYDGPAAVSALVVAAAMLLPAVWRQEVPAAAAALRRPAAHRAGCMAAPAPVPAPGAVMAAEAAVLQLACHTYILYRTVVMHRPTFWVEKSTEARQQ